MKTQPEIIDERTNPCYNESEKQRKSEMILYAKAVIPLINEYLRKFPEEDLKTIHFEVSDNLVFLEINGDIQSLRLANVVFNVVLKHLQIPERSKFFSFDLSLAIEESLMNVFNHSYNEHSGKAGLKLSFEPDRATVVLTDYGENGKNFDFTPTENTDKFAARGRGIMLIHKAVNHLEYESNGGQNILRFYKLYREEK